eukprot:g33891.t1
MEQAISIQQKKTSPSRKTVRNHPINDMDNTDSWIKNILDRTLTDTEMTVLVRGQNYNYRDAKKTDFLAVLESTLKTNGLTEEVQQTIRQTIVPTPSKKVGDAGCEKLELAGGRVDRCQVRDEFWIQLQGVERGVGTLSNKVMKRIDEDRVVDMIYMDFSKAFDNVPH